MGKIRKIIVHCSDSEWGSAAEIRRWHLERGWRDIGYHFVISNGHIVPGLYIPCIDGSIEIGRQLDDDGYLSGDEIGAHALGHNATSIGVCLIGKDRFQPRQYDTLEILLEQLMTIYGLKISDVLGHYETESGKKQGKTCPNIDGVVEAKLS